MTRLGCFRGSFSSPSRFYFFIFYYVSKSSKSQFKKNFFFWFSDNTTIWIMIENRFRVIVRGCYVIHLLNVLKYIQIFMTYSCKPDHFLVPVCVIRSARIITVSEPSKTQISYLYKLFKRPLLLMYKHLRPLFTIYHSCSYCSVWW